MLLGLDTSAVAASAALWEDGKIIGENFVNVKLTHSQTILPMVQGLFSACGKTISQVDQFAVSTGPGSFTGLRIGISAVKGMAFGTKKRCIPVSTLEALAYNLLGQECVAVAVMDARCQQVYTATFLLGRESVQRLSEDAAVSIEALKEQLSAISLDLPMILVGDGAELCYNNWDGGGAILAPDHLRYQRASSVCMAALPQRDTDLDPAQLVPAYLRLPQAQRELLAKGKKG